MPHARIAITLPAADLAAADRLAAAQDRSRSWIIAESIRRYAASQAAGQGHTISGGAGAADAEESVLGASRLAQLRRDLALTPEARVRAAEETLRASPRRSLVTRHHMVAFERYEDYLDAKRSRAREA